MIGIYRVYKSGVLVAEQPNVITSRGKGLILGYLAGNMPTFAGAIAAGTSSTPTTINDNKLGFEFMRGKVTVGAPIASLSQVVYKATMPLNSAGFVHEMGLYPYAAGTDSEYSGTVFVGFDPLLESLTGGGANTTNYRLGVDSYSVTANAGSTTAVEAANTRGNFGGYSNSDPFSLSYFTNDAFTDSILVELRVDSSNYFQYTVQTPSTVGYHIADFTKSNFTVIGNPSWDLINNARFVVTADVGGNTTVQLDGLRINDGDIYPDYALVSRAILPEPILKAPGEQMEIEYALEFNI